jgi:putative transposase
LARHGTPEIFNTDQGSQFTSTDFIKVLAARETSISMPLVTLALPMHCR